jgi:hypothetical protein
MPSAFGYRSITHKKSRHLGSEFYLRACTEGQKTHNGQVSSSSYPSTIRLASALGDSLGASVLNRFDIGELWSEELPWRGRFTFGRDSLVEWVTLANGTKCGHEMRISENNIALRFTLPDVVRTLT